MAQTSSSTCCRRNLAESLRFPVQNASSSVMKSSISCSECIVISHDERTLKPLIQIHTYKHTYRIITYMHTKKHTYTIYIYIYIYITCALIHSARAGTVICMIFNPCGGSSRFLRSITCMPTYSKHAHMLEYLAPVFSRGFYIQNFGGLKRVERSKPPPKIHWVL